MHQFQPLSGREFQTVVERQWVQLGLDSVTSTGLDVELLNTIARVTGGNFRLIQRLLAQIERLLAVNNMAAVTAEVVDAARESLVVSSASSRTLALRQLACRNSRHIACKVTPV